MINIPAETYEAAIDYLSRHVDIGTSGRWLLTDEDVRGLAAAVGAAGRDQAAADIRAHADKHAPKDGNRAQLTLRRHLFIAERVAAGPMTRAEVVEALNAMFGGEPQP